MRPHGSRDRAPIPSEPDPARGSPALGAGGVWVAAAAAAAGVGSAYWDDSWHTKDQKKPPALQNLEPAFGAAKSKPTAIIGGVALTPTRAKRKNSLPEIS